MADPLRPEDAKSVLAKSVLDLERQRDNFIRKYPMHAEVFDGSVSAQYRVHYGPEVRDLAYEIQARLVQAKLALYRADPAGEKAGEPKAPAQKRTKPSEPPCYDVIKGCLRDKPKLDLNGFVKLMDGKCEQHKQNVKYQPPPKWNVRTWREQLNKRPNTISALLSRLRSQLAI